MQNVAINLPPALELATAAKAVDAALAEMGLEVTLRGSLRKFPGCTHSHAKTPGQSGTLEVTVWPQEHRAWLTIQSGRTAGWIDDRLPEIRAALSRHLTAP